MGRPKGSKNKVQKITNKSKSHASNEINININTSSQGRKRHKTNNTNEDNNEHIQQVPVNFSSQQSSGHKYNSNTNFLPVTPVSITNDGNSGLITYLIDKIENRNSVQTQNPNITVPIPDTNHPDTNIKDIVQPIYDTYVEPSIGDQIGLIAAEGAVGGVAAVGAGYGASKIGQGYTKIKPKIKPGLKGVGGAIVNIGSAIGSAIAAGGQKLGGKVRQATGYKPNNYQNLIDDVTPATPAGKWKAPSRSNSVAQKEFDAFITNGKQPLVKPLSPVAASQAFSNPHTPIKLIDFNDVSIYPTPGASAFKPIVHSPKTPKTLIKEVTPYLPLNENSAVRKIQGNIRGRIVRDKLDKIAERHLDVEDAINKMIVAPKARVSGSHLARARSSSSSSGSSSSFYRESMASLATTHSPQSRQYYQSDNKAYRKGQRARDKNERGNTIRQAVPALNPHNPYNQGYFGDFQHITINPDGTTGPRVVKKGPKKK